MRRAVIFGAGNVGRGFLGQLLCEAGWSVTFLDVSPDLVAALATSGCYPHVTVGPTGPVRTVIAPVTALDVRDVEAAVEALVTADLAATSVGARALPAVADTLALALARRIELGRPPLNVLLAENVHDCAAVMAGLLAERLPELPAGLLAANVGLVGTSIGRMIPAPDKAATLAEPGLILTEAYRYLPYDGAAVVGDLPVIPGLVHDDSIPFAFYGDRKLYVHNLGHFFTANLGLLVGDVWLSDSIGRPAIRFLVRAAMVESALALSSRYAVSPGPLLDHVDDLLHRFDNRALGDTNERVGRDPERKLAGGDRLLGALRGALELGLPSRHLSLAVATGTVRLLAEPGWHEGRVWAHLEAGLGDVMDAGRRRLLRAQVAALGRGFDFNTQLDLIGQTYEPSRVI
ncbi:MAG: mannitol-1-phosphate 5-dehydrogenase [Propionibacteriaceae bacterium]|nr:mannitol-1-phosphate 5-dehydrogenase [Propionibacteriaceae bacterium]